MRPECVRITSLVVCHNRSPMSPSVGPLIPAQFSCCETTFRLIETYGSWLQRFGWSCAVLLIVSTFSGAPDLQHYLQWKPGWSERALDWKLRHPLSPIPVSEFAPPMLDPANQGTVIHLAKRTYRLTLPIVAYCFGLDLRGAEIVAALCSLAFSQVILLCFRRLLPADPVTAFLLTVTVAASFIGQWGASELGSFFLTAL